MDYNDRNLDIIKDIPLGTHIAVLYPDNNKFIGILSEFIKAGLKNNEMCLWVYAQEKNSNTVRDKISKTIPDIDFYIEKGQFRVISCKEWYISDNRFDGMKVRNKWSGLTRQSIEKGFSAFRVVGDTSWVDKSLSKSFHKYEESLNDIFTEFPITVLCAYDVTKLDVYELANVLKNHSYIVAENNGKPELIKNIELIFKEKLIAEKKKLLEEARESERIKTEFMTNISHELKTPLSVILSAIQLLLKTKKKI